MERDGVMDFPILEIPRKGSTSTGIVMQDRLHLIIPRARNPSKLLDATANFDVLMCAVQVFEAR